MCPRFGNNRDRVLFPFWDYRVANIARTIAALQHFSFTISQRSTATPSHSARRAGATRSGERMSSWRPRPAQIPGPHGDDGPSRHPIDFRSGPYRVAKSWILASNGNVIWFRGKSACETIVHSRERARGGE